MVDAHSFAFKRNSEYLAGRSSARLFQNTALNGGVSPSALKLHDPGPSVRDPVTV